MRKMIFFSLFSPHVTQSESYNISIYEWKHSLLPYPSLAHSGADKEEVEPRGDGGSVRSRPSSSCT